MALKYKGKKFNPLDNVHERKIRIGFDKTILRMFIGYLLIESKYITRANYINMGKLFDMLDMTKYEYDTEMYDMINFIKLMLQARLEKGISNPILIVAHCTNGMNESYKKIASHVDEYIQIKETEIRSINKCVTDRLQYAFLVFYKDILVEQFERLDTGEFDTYEEVNSQLKDIITHLTADMRKADTLVSLDTFSLSDDIFDSVVTDIVKRLKDKSRRFTTGIRMLNKILSPGFMSGRLYMFLARTANFKSGILLTIAKWFKYYNYDVQPKRNPNAIPTVLLLTTENSVSETVARLFSMVVPGENIEELSPEEVIRQLKEVGKLTLTGENNVDIVIKYYNDREIDTNDIYGIIEDIENENREVVALIVDYIKRIRAAESGRGDERIELKNCSNELKSLAQNLDIPVITAMQINRAGNATVEMGMTQSKEDLARFIGATNVANCWDLIENSDWVCIINIERRKDNGTYYLTFKRTKIRYADHADGQTYFNHPFADGDKIRLVDDVYLSESLSVESLASDLQGVNTSVGKKGRTSAKKRQEITEENNQAEMMDLSQFAAGGNK